MIILSLDELALLSYLSKNGKQPLEVAINSCMRGDAGKPHIEVLEKYGLLIKEGDYLSVSEGVELIFQELSRRGIDPFYLPESTTWLVIDPYPVFKERKFTPDKSSCFVLMPFSEDWSNRIWKKIREIVQEVGFRCIRADDLYGQNVMEDIWSAINTARVIVADITGRNPNVFYELGIAHTIGSSVILLSQNTKDIPFDLAGFRCIVYQDNADGYEILRRDLTGMLEEVKLGIKHSSA